MVGENSDIAKYRTRNCHRRHFISTQASHFIYFHSVVFNQSHTAGL